jgi:hypothetical protein
MRSSFPPGMFCLNSLHRCCITVLHHFIGVRLGTGQEERHLPKKVPFTVCIRSKTTTIETNTIIHVMAYCTLPFHRDKELERIAKIVRITCSGRVSSKSNV